MAGSGSTFDKSVTLRISSFGAKIGGIIGQRILKLTGIYFQIFNDPQLNLSIYIEQERLIADYKVVQLSQDVS